jgi:DNA-binding YbaB/EbfC family protein
MSQNPFDALGGGPGGLDLNALLQQAQQMQSDLQAAQERIASTIVDGTVAGGAVTVRMTGAGDLTAVDIRPDAVDGTDADALADLGDLIVAAFRDAKSQVDDLAQQTLGPLAGGLPDIPGLTGGGSDGPTPGQLGF